jgi:hypothetical protein
LLAHRCDLHPRALKPRGFLVTAINYTQQSGTIYNYINLLYKYIAGAITLIEKNNLSILKDAHDFLNNFFTKRNNYLPPLIADIINNLMDNVVLKHDKAIDLTKAPSVSPQDQAQIVKEFELRTAGIWLYANNPTSTSFEHIVNRTITLCEQAKTVVQNMQMKLDIEFILNELKNLPNPFTKKAIKEAAASFQRHSANYPKNESPVTKEAVTALLAALNKAVLNKTYK